MPGYYAWIRQALLLETASSGTGSWSPLTPRRQTGGTAADYSNKAVRDSEREAMGNEEEVYRRFVAAWKQQPPNGCPDASNEVRLT